MSDFENNLVSCGILRNDNHEEGTIYCNMDDIPEERGQELYNKLNSEYLIECAKNNRIQEWNADYLEYLQLEWNRLYPERIGDPKYVEVLFFHYQFRISNLDWEDDSIK